MLSTHLLKSQSADSLLNSVMETALPVVVPTNNSWLDGLGAGSKEIDLASSHGVPETQEAFLSPLSNKGQHSILNFHLSFVISVCHNLLFPPMLMFLLLFLLFFCSSVEECSIGSATDLTETSSMVDGDWTMVDEHFTTLCLSQSELEHISMELANKGPHKSQVQLR